jgi:hypothetical protein
MLFEEKNEASVGASHGKITHRHNTKYYNRSFLKKEKSTGIFDFASACQRRNF